MAFWISGTIFKLIPCLLLTLLVWLLKRILDDVKEKRKRLIQGTNSSTKMRFVSLLLSLLPKINNENRVPQKFIKTSDAVLSLNK